jgi:hypothetical protein
VLLLLIPRLHDHRNVPPIADKDHVILVTDDDRSKQMLQMQAQENMEEMAGSPIWAMEVVKSAYFFLKEKQKCDDVTDHIIVKFLAWPFTRIKDAMSNLRSTGEIPQGKQAHEEQPHIQKEVFVGREAKVGRFQNDLLL